ncbi:MAG: OmpH family outer membrane protein [Myxococcota bacterium]|nr:OmpH family outer membrane protein [Myxococcota bacterium]
MKKNIAKAAAVSLVLALSAVGPSAAMAQALKIAFVDRMRALNETHEGKAAMKRLEKMKEKLQRKIKDKESSIMAMKETLEKQQNVLTKEALQKKAEEYYRSVNELQQSYMQFQKELAGKEAELTKEILVKMDAIMTEIGRSDGYTMIYDRATVVWAPAHLDLTDKLIQMYNSKHKGKKKAKKK